MRDVDSLRDFGAAANRGDSTNGLAKHLPPSLYASFVGTCSEWDLFLNDRSCSSFLATLSLTGGGSPDYVSPWLSYLDLFTRCKIGSNSALTLSLLTHHNHTFFEAKTLANLIRTLYRVLEDICALYILPYKFTW